MGVVAALTWLTVAFWDLLQDWLQAVFIAPFANFEMFWILVPIYLGWITADFFQEKRGTSLGNAITNGVIPLWAGIDWIRTTIGYLTKEHLKMAFLDAASRFALAACVLVYGGWIIYAGVKGRPLTRYIGRVRTVSYVVILFTPVFYNAMELTLKHVFATLFFFPFFYYIVEVFERLTPDPKSIADEKGYSPLPPR